MSQPSVVARLAVRELWITFRLLAILVAFIGAGSVAALAPALPLSTPERLAVGLALATSLTAGVAAWSLAEERTSGRAGWLVTRSVSRGTYVMAWFAAVSSVAAIGLVGAAALGWMGLGAIGAMLEPWGFVAVIAAVAADVGAAVALGLVLGSLARAAAAALGTLLTCAAVGAASVALPPLDAVVAHALVPRVAEGAEILPAALRAAGIGLLAAAVLLALARIAMARAEL